MKAVLVRPPEPGARVAEVPAPIRTPGLVRVRVVEVGVCGTDRDVAAGEYGRAPVGRSELVLGHENLGRIVESDPALPGAPSPGDWVVATVRRGCGRCGCCAAGRSDSCETGRYTERGILGADGYWSEEYVEAPSYLVPVPRELAPIAVLTEPLSIVQKAIRVGLADRSARRPSDAAEAGPLRALVAGTGAVGMLAALSLRRLGAGVTALDRHPGETPAARMLERAGAEHLVMADLGPAAGGRSFDLVVEATGAPEVAFDLADRLAPNGCLVLTGIPEGGRPPAAEDVGEWARHLVLGNRAVVGSVNAGRIDFTAALQALAGFERSWPGLAAGLISARRPIDEAPEVLSGRVAGEVKTVLTIGPA